MSPVFKWMLVCTSFCFAGGFVYLAVFLGHVFPKGPAPFYIIGAVCGAAGLFFLSVRPIPFDGGIKPQTVPPPQPMEVEHGTRSSIPRQDEDLDDVNVYDMDLTRISPAGCLLCLSSVVVMLMVAGILAVFAPDLLADRAPKKVAGAIMVGAIAAYFFAGRFILKKLGFTFMRKRR